MMMRIRIVTREHDSSGTRRVFDRQCEAIEVDRDDSWYEATGVTTEKIPGDPDGRTSFERNGRTERREIWVITVPREELLSADLFDCDTNGQPVTETNPVPAQAAPTNN